LQASQSHNKWSNRTCMGIFLCHSPSHALNVPLVLNTQTGLVSPQFHRIYDSQFNTCKQDAKFISLWQFKAKLQGRPRLSTVERNNILPTIGSPLPTYINWPPLASEDVLRWFTILWDLPAPETAGPAPVQPTPPNEVDAIAENVPVLPIAADPDWIGAPPVEPAVVTRSGRAIRRHAQFVQNVILVAAYLARYSPQPADHRLLQLLQPDIE
jgi:hypothetical protein